MIEWRTRQSLEDAPDGIDVGAGIDVVRAVKLLGGRKAVGTPHSVGPCIGITVTQVDELDVVANAGDEDVVGFEVEMDNLVGM